MRLKYMEEDLNVIGEELREKDCPDLRRNILSVLDTLDVLSGKWTVPVAMAIIKGRSRFSAIRDFWSGLTDKVLYTTLNHLILNRMVIKKGENYIITEHGVSLYKVIQEMCAWGQRHRHVMLE